MPPSFYYENAEEETRARDGLPDAGLLDDLRRHHQPARRDAAARDQPGAAPERRPGVRTPRTAAAGFALAGAARAADLLAAAGHAPAPGSLASALRGPMQTGSQRPTGAAPPPAIREPRSGIGSPLAGAERPARPHAARRGPRAPAPPMARESSARPFGRVDAPTPRPEPPTLRRRRRRRRKACGPRAWTCRRRPGRWWAESLGHHVRGGRARRCSASPGSSDMPEPRRSGTGKTWLALGVLAVAAVVGGLWAVPKLMQPRPEVASAPPPAAPEPAPAPEATAPGANPYAPSGTAPAPARPRRPRPPHRGAAAAPRRGARPEPPPAAAAGGAPPPPPPAAPAAADAGPARRPPRRRAARFATSVRLAAAPSRPTTVIAGEAPPGGRWPGSRHRHRRRAGRRPGDPHAGRSRRGGVLAVRAHDASRGRRADRRPGRGQDAVPAAHLRSQPHLRAHHSQGGLRAGRALDERHRSVGEEGQPAHLHRDREAGAGPGAAASRPAAEAARGTAAPPPATPPAGPVPERKANPFDEPGAGAQP